MIRKANHFAKSRDLVFHFDLASVARTLLPAAFDLRWDLNKSWVPHPSLPLARMGLLTLRGAALQRCICEPLPNLSFRPEQIDSLGESICGVEEPAVCRKLS